jgi:hypothetical protein
MKNKSIILMINLVFFAANTAIAMDREEQNEGREQKGTRTSLSLPSQTDPQKKEKTPERNHSHRALSLPQEQKNFRSNSSSSSPREEQNGFITDGQSPRCKSKQSSSSSMQRKVSIESRHEIIEESKELAMGGKTPRKNRASSLHQKGSASPGRESSISKEGSKEHITFITGKKSPRPKSPLRDSSGRESTLSNEGSKEHITEKKSPRPKSPLRPRNDLIDSPGRQENISKEESKELLKLERKPLQRTEAVSNGAVSPLLQLNGLTDSSGGQLGQTISSSEGSKSEERSQSKEGHRKESVGSSRKAKKSNSKSQSSSPPEEQRGLPTESQKRRMEVTPQRHLPIEAGCDYDCGAQLRDSPERLENISKGEGSKELLEVEGESLQCNEAASKGTISPLLQQNDLPESFGCELKSPSSQITPPDEGPKSEERAQSLEDHQKESVNYSKSQSSAPQEEQKELSQEIETLSNKAFPSSQEEIINFENQPLMQEKQSIIEEESSKGQANIVTKENENSLGKLKILCRSEDCKQSNKNPHIYFKFFDSGCEIPYTYDMELEVDEEETFVYNSFLRDGKYANLKEYEKSKLLLKTFKSTCEEYNNKLLNNNDESVFVVRNPITAQPRSTGSFSIFSWKYENEIPIERNSPLFNHLIQNKKLSFIQGI